MKTLSNELNAEEQESKSDKILNNFLMNYFKKKNNFILRSKRTTIKR